MRNLLLGLILAHGIGPCAMPSHAASIGYPPGGGSTSASDLTSGTLPNARLDSSSVTLKGNWSLEMPGPIQGASVSASSATLSSTTATGTLSTTGDSRFGFTVYASSISLSSAVHSGSLTLSSGAVIEKTLWVNEGVRASTLNAINVTASSNVFTNSLTVSSGAVIGKSLSVAEGVEAATVTVVNVAASSNTRTGSLTVSSGAVVGKSLWVAENVSAGKYIGDGSQLTNLPASVSASSAACVWRAGSTFSNTAYAVPNGTMTITVSAGQMVKCMATALVGGDAGIDCFYAFHGVQGADAYAENFCGDVGPGGDTNLACAGNTLDTALPIHHVAVSPQVRNGITSYAIGLNRRATGSSCSDNVNANIPWRACCWVQ